MTTTTLAHSRPWSRLRPALALAGGVLAYLALGGPARAADPPERLNVLVLFTDDQRADTIHALGNPVIQTPNLDRLARSGFVARNAYCMGGSVPAVCLPSRVMFLSGRSLFHVRDRLQANYRPNWPEVFRSAGYETYHHGKNGNVSKAMNAHFEHNRYLVNDEAERRSGHPGKEVTDAAVQFLTTARDPSRPFFMYLAFGNPHDPRVVVPEVRARYPEADLPLPPNFRPLHPFDNGELESRDEALAPWPRTPEAVRADLADYYGVITYMDQQIGRILDALRVSGQADRTLIVFTSDQGLAVGSHGLFGKQNVYEDGMKVPFAMVGPGIATRSSDAFVYLFDLFPTVCELVGITPPEGIDGRSFAAVVRGTETEARSTILLAYRDVQRAVRRGDWKLIRYPRIHRSQLFDLASDPHETCDLAGDPAQAARVEELTRLLVEQQAAFGDALPLTSPNPDPAEIDRSFFMK